MLSKFVIVISANPVCIAAALLPFPALPFWELLERTPVTLSRGALALQPQLPRYSPLGSPFSGSLPTEESTGAKWQGLSAVASRPGLPWVSGEPASASSSGSPRLLPNRS